MYLYAARLAKIVDADTLDLHVDLGFGIWVNQRIRLLGINAPEKNTIQGKQAVAYVQTWLHETDPDLTLRTVRDTREKYGRYLGTITAGLRTLNTDLITAGHPVPYDGGTRLPAQPGQPRNRPPVP